MASRRSPRTKKNGHVPPAEEPRLPAPIPKKLGPGPSASAQSGTASSGANQRRIGEEAGRGRGADSGPIEPDTLPPVSGSQRPAHRAARVDRVTRETDIRLMLDLDGTGHAVIDTPIPFFSHLLEALAKHSLIDLEVSARGDVEVDPHHTVEDVGICFGRALVEAIGDRRGLTRYGDATLPFDEALVRCAVDLGGRAAYVYRVAITPGRIGSFDVELSDVFFRAVAHEGRMNLHLALEYGENRHHIVEGLMKTFARALEQAVRLDPRRAHGVPSTKGILD